MMATCAEIGSRRDLCRRPRTCAVGVPIPRSLDPGLLDFVSVAVDVELDGADGGEDVVSVARRQPPVQALQVEQVPGQRLDVAVEADALLPVVRIPAAAVRKRRCSCMYRAATSSEYGER
jgi:hypothetical protein